MYVVKWGSIWPTSYLYLTGYDMEWANFRKEIVEEMEKQYRGRGLNFFSYGGKSSCFKIKLH